MSGYGDQRWLKLERPASVEPTGPKGRRRRGPGRTDYLLCVQLDAMPAPLTAAVLEAKKEYVFATNGHRYGEFDRFTQRQSGPFPLADFPSQAELTARYARDLGIDLSRPEAAVLFQADSPAWSRSRYYQDATIRAALHAILRGQLNGEVVRLLLSLATGAGKTVIATNLLWRLTQAGHLTKPALFLCDRDELREQAYGKLKAAFGDNARIVRREQGTNAARNARIHIATYQTLGLDDEDGFASFLTEHYGPDAFSVIIIDECHRSAWGRWSEVLRRNPNAIHIGLTATPRQLQESKQATDEGREISANNLAYFGPPVYEYSLIQAQEDGYLAACEIVQRKANIDDRVFTRAEILQAGVCDIRTGRRLTEDDLTKDEYRGRDFDDELFIELRTPAMCDDLFQLLCENGGPEQKVIVFCTREIHADRVAQRFNNLYADWCERQGRAPKEHYAFKCMGGPNKGADLIEPMRGSSERAFIACTEDLLLKMGEKNSDGGQFFTPREVIRAMVRTVDPHLGQTVYDPCCRTGGFLATAYEHIARALGPTPTSTDLDRLKHETFFGREKENLVFPIALANLVLHGIDQPNLWHGNTLTRRATPPMTPCSSTRTSPRDAPRPEHGCSRCSDALPAVVPWWWNSRSASSARRRPIPGPTGSPPWSHVSVAGRKPHATWRHGSPTSTPVCSISRRSIPTRSPRATSARPRPSSTASNSRDTSWRNPWRHCAAGWPTQVDGQPTDRLEAMDPL